MSITNDAGIVHHAFLVRKRKEAINKEIAILGRKKREILGGYLGGSTEN
ncbi:MAG: hypothetical protein IJM92_06840 [Fibrobacter sp.]|nr:hypothetical protein [Fibrobacter sp.]MBQ7079370.1 hypothetical protein [Fibrobacter sp.]